MGGSCISFEKEGKRKITLTLNLRQLLFPTKITKCHESIFLCLFVIFVGFLKLLIELKMHMFSKILRPLTDLVRHILSKPNERGELTSDLFRFKIRAKTRQLIKDHSGFLLDIGCGDGLLHEGLMTKQNKLGYIGIDTEHEILKIAKERFHKKKQNRLGLLKAHAQNLPFLDKTINIAICINTFYNFHTKGDVVNTLNEMERVCKRDGFIIFDVRNKINPFVYLRFKFVWIYDTHVTLNAYSLKELTTALTSKGLVVKETIPIGFPITMFAPIILVKVGHQ